jgi:hypothetical protein
MTFPNWESLLYTPCVLGLHSFAFSNKIELIIKKKTTICLIGVFTLVESMWIP